MCDFSTNMKGYGTHGILSREEKKNDLNGTTNSKRKDKYKTKKIDGTPNEINSMQKEIDYMKEIMKNIEKMQENFVEFKEDEDFEREKDGKVEQYYEEEEKQKQDDEENYKKENEENAEYYEEQEQEEDYIKEEDEEYEEYYEKEEQQNKEQNEKDEKNYEEEENDEDYADEEEQGEKLEEEDEDDKEYAEEEKLDQDLEEEQELQEQEEQKEVMNEGKEVLKELIYDEDKKEQENQMSEIESNAINREKYAVNKKEVREENNKENTDDLTEKASKETERKESDINDNKQREILGSKERKTKDKMKKNKKPQKQNGNKPKEETKIQTVRGDFGEDVLKYSASIFELNFEQQKDIENKRNKNTESKERGVRNNELYRKEYKDDSEREINFLGTENNYTTETSSKYLTDSNTNVSSFKNYKDNITNSICADNSDFQVVKLFHNEQKQFLESNNFNFDEEIQNNSQDFNGKSRANDNIEAGSTDAKTTTTIMNSTKTLHLCQPLIFHSKKNRRRKRNKQ